MFCQYFFAELNMAKDRHLSFRVLGPETEKRIKLPKTKKKTALTCSVAKVAFN